MDTVVYDRIEDVLGRIESLYGRVEDTYLVAKDILLGTQISDWIADLKASGTASATYSDATRMNALIANEDAANNVDVAKYLVQWAVANNKYGTYCGAACGAVSGVTWDSLTTPNAVMSNATAFTALCGNSVATEATVRNSTCKQAMWANITVCEPILTASSEALLAMKNVAGTNKNVNQSVLEKIFLVDLTANLASSANLSLVYAAGGSGQQEVKFGTTFTSNRFLQSLSISLSQDYAKPKARYINFS